MRKVYFLLLTLIVLGSSCSEKIKCGTVTYKGQELYSPRKSTNIYMNNVIYVQYDKKEVQKNVDIRTYEKHNVGDRVCFKEQYISKYFSIPFLILSIPLVIYLIYSLFKP